MLIALLAVLGVQAEATALLLGPYSEPAYATAAGRERL
jgi:hypothetical protein